MKFYKNGIWNLVEKISLNDSYFDRRKITISKNSDNDLLFRKYENQWMSIVQIRESLV